MRTIKKIAALITGATMIGATVMGAMAADLSNYPAPFVEGCSFNGAIVVGARSESSDVVGATDIATRLAISGTTTETGVGTGVTAEGEAYKVERSTNRLNLGDDVADIGVTITNSHLPTVLARGTYRTRAGRDNNYEQTIKLGSSEFTVQKDRDLNNDLPTLGLNYNFDEEIMTYELKFTSYPESDVTGGDKLVDFEDTTLTLLGRTYDLVEARNYSSGTELTLMGGAVKDMLELQQVKTYTLDGKDYEVELVYVGTDERARFKVNGELTKVMTKGDTDKLSDGTQIGVREVLDTQAGKIVPDMVEFYIGSQRLTLTDGRRLELNEDDVDEIMVTISEDATGSKYKLQGIKLEWSAYDEEFVWEKNELLMPGLESVKLYYAGLTRVAEEEVVVKPTGTDGIELIVPIRGNDNFRFQVFECDDDRNIVRLGRKDRELMTTTTNQFTNYSLSGNVRHQYMVISNDASYETVFLEATRIDTNGVTFEDRVNGQRWDDRKVGDTFEVLDMTFEVVNYTVGADRNVTINTTSADFVGNVIFTPQKMEITLPTAANVSDGGANNYTSFAFTFKEEVDDANLQGQTFYVPAICSTEETRVSVPTGAGGVLSSFEETDKKDLYEAWVLAGKVATRIHHDRGPDQYEVKIFHPGAETFGNLFVAEAKTGFGTVTTAGGLTVCPVTVPATSLDTEISSVSAQNLIIVGGPCANTVAASVMGVPGTIPECLAGFEEGKAMIKLYDTGAGKTAMLVAGMTAMDTRRAARVLREYEKHSSDLVGDEVEVTGTSLTQIDVKKIA